MRYTSDDLMIVAAARHLATARSCFVGIGAPSAAANVARLVINPDLVLIYESGAIGAKPYRLPLSIGDGSLAATADTVVPIVELFNQWLQPGRIDTGFLAAAQLDPYANINTTVVGEYGNPSVRLPGAGGAPEIAAACRETMIIARHTRRIFVERVDFVTSFGHRRGDLTRSALGHPGSGPTKVITDLAVLEPDDTGELVVTCLQPGVELSEVIDATGWPLRAGPRLQHLDPPHRDELQALAQLRGERS